MITFPLIPDLKIPLCKWRNLKKSVPHHGHHGLKCGQLSGITVVDVDIFPKGGGEAHKETADFHTMYKNILNTTRRITTASSNYHYIFEYTPLPNTNLRKVGLDMEIKNNGSYVVGEGSVVGGVKYKRTNNKEIVKMPDELVLVFTNLLKSNKVQKHKCNCDVPPCVVKKYGKLKKCDNDITTRYGPIVCDVCPDGIKHKTNNTYLIYHKKKDVWYEKCFDEECTEIKMIDFEPDDKEFDEVYFRKIRSYDRCKIYFEKYHFKIRKPTSYVRLYVNYGGEATFDVLSSMQLKDTYFELQYDMETNGKMKTGLQFITKWIKDDTLQVKKGLIFSPNANKARYFNLFNRFHYETLDQGEENDTFIEEIKNLIKNLVGDDEEGYKKVILFISDILQRPNSKTYNKCLVFTGKQGTGKTAFWEWVGKNIIGKDYFKISRDIDDYAGRFASGIFHKLLCVMEEMSGKDGFELSEKLKDNITGTTVGYEQKYKDKIEVKNLARFVVLTNNPTPVKVEQSDRRYEPFETSDTNRNDRDYWNMMFNIVFPHEPTQRAFAEYCKNYELSGWPETESRLKKEMALSTLTPTQRFVINMARNRCLIDDDTPFPLVFTIRDLHIKYNDYISSNGGHPISDIKLGKEIRRISKDIQGLQWDTGKGNVKRYSFDMKRIFASYDT